MSILTDRKQYKQIIEDKNILSDSLINEFGTTISSDYMKLWAEFPVTAVHTEWFGDISQDDVAANACQQQYFDCIDIIRSCRFNIFCIEKTIGNYYNGTISRSFHNSDTFVFKCVKNNWTFDIIFSDDCEMAAFDISNVVNLSDKKKANIRCDLYYTSDLQLCNFFCLLSSADFETYQKTRFGHIHMLDKLFAEKGHNVIKSSLFDYEFYDINYRSRFDYILTLDDQIHVIVDELEFHKYTKEQHSVTENTATIFLRIFPSFKKLKIDYQQIKQANYEKEKRLFEILRPSFETRRNGTIIKKSSFESLFPETENDTLDRESYDEYLKSLSISIGYEMLDDFENVYEKIKTIFNPEKNEK